MRYTSSLAKQVVFAFAIAMTAAGCRDDVEWTESKGDVAGGSYKMLDYEVTSERYRQWIAAHRALDGVELGEPMSVDLRNLSEKDIDRIERTLEDHAAARTSIESSGMSVRDFVLTTVALAQPWAQSSSTLSANVDIANPGPAVTRHVSAPQSIPVRVESDDSENDSEGDSGKKKRKKKGRGRG